MGFIKKRYHLISIWWYDSVNPFFLVAVHVQFFRPSKVSEWTSCANGLLIYLFMFLFKSQDPAPGSVQKKVADSPTHHRSFNICMKKLALNNIWLLPPGTVDMFFGSANCQGTRKLLAMLMFTRCNAAIKIAAGQHEHENFTPGRWRFALMYNNIFN